MSTLAVWVAGEQFELRDSGGPGTLDHLPPSALHDPANAHVPLGLRQLLRETGTDVERLSDAEVLSIASRSVERGELILAPPPSTRASAPPAEARLGEDYALVKRGEAKLYEDWQRVPDVEVDTWLRGALVDPSEALLSRCEALIGGSNVREAIEGDALGGGLAVLRRALLTDATVALLRKERFALGEPPAPRQTPMRAERKTSGVLGVTSLSHPRCIAPGKETVDVAYTIHDPRSLATKATLELYRDGADAPVWTKTLSGDELKHGDHGVPWDGSVSHADFPDGVVTAKWSPYTWRVTIEGAADPSPKEQTDTFEVIPHLLLELGPSAWLEHTRDKQVWHALQALPPHGQWARVLLKSNMFMRAAAEMKDPGVFFERYGSDKASTELQSWGDGPLIPVRAKLRVKSSGGDLVVAPAALRGGRVMWDYVDVSESAALASAVRTFIDAERARFPDQPVSNPGENCHAERGGLRNKGGALFKHSPFGSLSPGSKRTWAAFTTIEEADDDCASGALFQASRMAGDAYQLRAFYDARNAFDVIELPEGAKPSETGGLVIWRQLHLRRYMRKNASVPIADLEAVKRSFADAYVQLDVAPDAVQVMDESQFNDHVTAFMSTQKHGSVALDPTVSQTRASGSPLFARSYAVLKGTMFEETRRIKADLTGATGSALDAAVHDAVAERLGKMGIPDEDAYLDKLFLNARVIAEDWCEKHMADDGITVIHFSDGVVSDEFKKAVEERKYEVVAPLGTGIALAIAESADDQCVVLLDVASETHELAAFFVHEIGHQLFLPHARGGTADPTDTLHDPEFRAPSSAVSGSGCVMSYQWGTDNAGLHFCGLCNLRLRGWKIGEGGENIQLGDLWLRLEVDPHDAATMDDRFVLVSRDRSYRCDRTVKDDLVAGDAYTDLLFDKLNTGNTYTLRVYDEEGEEPWTLFDSVSYAELVKRFGNAPPDGS